MNIAFFGLGRRSLGFLKGLREADGVNLVAGADAWLPARLNARMLMSTMETYETREALLTEHRDLDLVMVFSRDCDHEADVTLALRHGHDVFTEKPLAISVASGRRMLDAAESARRRIMVGFNLRFHPTVREAVAFLESGRLGRLRTIWEWHEVDLNYFHNWMSVRANSGGLLFQKGSHDFDLFNVFSGSVPELVTGFGALDYYGGKRDNGLLCPECPEDGTCPESVGRGHRVFPPGAESGVPNEAQSRCAFRREIDVMDNHAVSIRFHNGVTGSYNEIHGSPVSQRRFMLLGTEGRLEFELGGNWLRWQPRDRQAKREEWSAEEAAGGHGGADSRLMDAILEVFRDGAPVPVTAIDGLKAIGLSEAAEEALRSRQVVVVPSL